MTNDEATATRTACERNGFKYTRIVSTGAGYEVWCWHKEPYISHGDPVQAPNKIYSELPSFVHIPTAHREIEYGVKR